mmetsp:Transcript_107932/g.311860  ORF Transcript_107932/g.311860 Transcript_107932/m.311860 type:complete len:286 (+) Transcript_107932:55-912(+)
MMPRRKALLIGLIIAGLWSLSTIMQSTSFHGVSEESFVQFRRRVEEDLAVWEGTVLDANSFLDSYKYHSTHGKRVSLVQLTATDVQVVAGVRPEEEEEGLKFWASRYVLGCSGRIEVLRMILEDFSNGVPGMRPHEVAYMLFNFDDSPISRPADRDACNAYLNESLGPDMVAAYLAKKGDYFFAAHGPDTPDVPIISHSKVPSCSRDLLMPWPDLFVHPQRLWCSGSFSRSMDSSAITPWNEKTPRIMWRGSLTAPLRAAVLSWAEKRNDTDVSVAKAGYLSVEA